MRIETELKALVRGDENVLPNFDYSQLCYKCSQSSNWQLDNNDAEYKLIDCATRNQNAVVELMGRQMAINLEIGLTDGAPVYYFTALKTRY